MAKPRMRIAVVDKERCQPKKCGQECLKYCPKVRSGDETVVIAEKAVISEKLCVGCGICIKKCPMKAIQIVGLPEKLEGREVHRYGVNGFVLYNLPVPRSGAVVGILGANGTGKSTAVRILSGQLKPNLGKEEADWEEIFERFSGTELLDYLKRLRDGKIRASIKPQYIETIPKAFRGKTRELLEKFDERSILDEAVEKLNLKASLNREVGDLSGGELQRVAIAVCYMRDADFYFFDEVTPYLDIYQRITVANVIKELSKEKTVMIVEHDLAILDMLADYVHVTYGLPGVYGVVTSPKSARVGINQYLGGYLAEENIRIRERRIEFEFLRPREGVSEKILLEYPSFRKSLNGFTLIAEKGDIRIGEVLGVVGANATGKSTFVKVLAGVLEDDEKKLKLNLRVSYKPQYVRADIDETVEGLLRKINPMIYSSFIKTEFLKPMAIEEIMDRNLQDLSGGELQRVAIVACLLREADLYLLDEPTAHLDVEQRNEAARLIRRFALNNSKSAIVVDHDIYFIDMVSDRLMLFEGEPGVEGFAGRPRGMREGMNAFLSKLGITFRRDEETKRPRVNKLDSRLDREQKAAGEYYYYRL
ncbi:MAG: ribosome biogenesis/translation initiation ATPase RLI [Candidatus Methanoglobus sp.]